MTQKPDCEHETDESLARRAREGEPTAFELLVARFQVPLRHFLRQYHNDADTDDLVQDAFLRAYRHLDSFDTSRKFSTWLFTIARRLSINLLRRRRMTTNTESFDREQAREQDPADSAARRDGHDHLWDRARQILPEPQWTALWLHYVEGMPVKEIAVVQGRTRVGVKTLLFRARKRLAPVLAESHDIEMCPPASDRSAGGDAIETTMLQRTACRDSHRASVHESFFISPEVADG